MSLASIPGGGFVATYMQVAGGGASLDTDIHIDEFTVNGSYLSTREIIPVAGNNFDNQGPYIASLSSTSNLVVWEDVPAGDVKGRVCNADTNGLGPVLTIANFNLNDIVGLEVTAMAQSNRYAVVFVDDDSPGDNDEVYLKILNSAGGAITGSILVDSSLEQASDPHVVELANGDLFVVWTGYTNGPKGLPF